LKKKFFYRGAGNAGRSIKKKFWSSINEIKELYDGAGNMEPTRFDEVAPVSGSGWSHQGVGVFANRSRQYLPCNWCALEFHPLSLAVTDNQLLFGFNQRLIDPEEPLNKLVIDCCGPISDTMVMSSSCNRCVDMISVLITSCMTRNLIGSAQVGTTSTRAANQSKLIRK